MLACESKDIQIFQASSTEIKMKRRRPENYNKPEPLQVGDRVQHLAGQSAMPERDEDVVWLTIDRIFEDGIRLSNGKKVLARHLVYCPPPEVIEQRARAALARTSFKAEFLELKDARDSDEFDDDWEYSADPFLVED